jgi:geranylgeranyl pyrophosphate synthase
MLPSVTPCASGVGHAGDLIDLVESRMMDLIHPEREREQESLSDAAGAAAYHLASGGQRVRARLALSSGKSLGLTDSDAVTIASCVELLHNASLIHDDLQDREQCRRGVKTVCAAYGDHIAICAGDLLVSAAYAALAHFSNPGMLPELLLLVHERTSVVIAGQCAELNPTGDALLDMDVYGNIAAGKSGSLLSLPIEMALLVSGKREWVTEARRAAEDFAIGYQIADDMEDVDQDERSRAVNAVLALKASGQGDFPSALATARERGLRHLDQAISRSGGLPGGSGSLLMELAQRLRDRL